MPEKTDYAYLAGIIDGEGYLAPGINSKVFGIVVKMTDEVIVDYLEDVFGGRRGQYSVTTKLKRVYTWQLQRMDELEEVLKNTLPYLVIKYDQATAMLELIEHHKNFPRYTTPTARSPKPERDRRRQERRDWSEKRDGLRVKIKEARLGW